MTVEAIPLEQWQEPAHPVRGARPFPWAALDWAVVHHRGSGAVPAPVDPESWLRGAQRDWLRRKRHSLGYSWAYLSGAGHPLDGTEYEVRGVRWQEAATGGVNPRSASFLVMNLDGEPATAAAARSMGNRLRWLRESSGRPVALTGHAFAPGATTPTGCPGAGLTADIRSGRIEQYAAIINPEGESDMLIIDHDYDSPRWVRLALVGGRLVWVYGAVNTVVTRTVPAPARATSVGEWEIRSLMNTFGTRGPSPWTPGHHDARTDSGLHSAWLAALS